MTVRRAYAGVLFAASLLAACGGSGAARTPPPAADGPDAEPTCHEGVTAKACAALQEIQLTADLPLPASHGNPKADDFDTAVFGFHMFFDARFSANQNVRCESCHSTDYGFADNQKTPTKGLGTGERNAPTVLNAARYTTFLWDGRADSLWSQPLIAIEAPNEMGFTRLEVAHLMGALYGKDYANVFGPLPDFSDAARFPARGKPGDPAFDAMAPEDQKAVNQVFSNMGKALEAYVRKLSTGPSPVDKYLGGDQSALTAVQVQGMYVFAGAGCLNCHSGPQLSDDSFHNLGVPALPDASAPDEGRAAGIPKLDASLFNASGPFYDGPPPSDAPDRTPVVGGFRTPSLRNLYKSMPYGHNGTFATLEDVVDFHLQGGGKNNDGYVGTVDPLLEPKTLSDDDRAALIEFLKAMTGAYPPLPWGQWPNGNG